jgi:hypothetical protein
MSERWLRTQKEDIGPPPRYGHVMAYEAARQRAAGDAARRISRAAVCARAVAVLEQGDDEVALGDAAHLCPDLLRHADRTSGGARAGEQSAEL